MIHDITLVPRHAGVGIGLVSFRWNDETGEFTGIGAVIAHETFARYVKRGYARIDPVPSTHVFSDDPWRTPADLAAAFDAAGYILPRVWGDAYPQPPDDDEPDDADSVPVIY